MCIKKCARISKRYCITLTIIWLTDVDFVVYVRKPFGKTSALLYLCHTVLRSNYVVSLIKINVFVLLFILCCLGKKTTFLFHVCIIKIRRDFCFVCLAQVQKSFFCDLGCTHCYWTGRDKLTHPLCCTVVDAKRKSVWLKAGCANFGFNGQENEWEAWRER